MSNTLTKYQVAYDRSIATSLANFTKTTRQKVVRVAEGRQTSSALSTFRQKQIAGALGNMSKSRRASILEQADSRAGNGIPKARPSSKRSKRSISRPAKQNNRRAQSVDSSSGNTSFSFSPSFVAKLINAANQQDCSPAEVLERALDSFTSK